MRGHCLALCLLLALAPTPGAGAEPADCPRRPARLLSRSLRLPTPTDADGWRPIRVASRDHRVAIVVAPLDAPGTPARIYLYERGGHDTPQLVADDGPVQLPTWWGHLHYKAGGVALTANHLVYCADTGIYDVLRARRLDDPTLVTDHAPHFRMDAGDPFLSEVETPFSCTNVAGDPGSETGVAFVASRPLGRWEYHLIAYRKIDGRATEATRRVHVSAWESDSDPGNSSLYDRGPAPHDGDVAWIWGGHLDRETTVRHRSERPDAAVRQLDGARYSSLGIERPTQISHFGERVALECGNDYQEAFTGIALWEPESGRVERLLPDAIGPALFGDVLLVSRREGIFKLDLSHPEPSRSMEQLTANETLPESPYGHTAVHLGGSGLFAYLRMETEGGKGSVAYLASVWQADGNLDGRVDRADLALLEAGRPEADFNRDGVVDRADWEILDAQWGAEGTTGEPRGQAPEPAPSFEATCVATPSSSSE